MTAVHRSVLLSALERYGNFLVLLVSAAFLSRLLTPEEFGVFALVSALTTIVSASFQEFGGANYLIQKPTLTDQDIQTAFTITFCLSALIVALCIGLSGFVARYFSKEGVAWGLAINALTLLLTPFSITVSALLRRQMAFGALAFCNLSGGVMTAVVSVILAAVGFSFMAPVWGTLAGVGTTVVLLVAVWRRVGIFRPSLAGYQDVVTFGAYSAGTVVINVFYNLFPQVILARVLDFGAVGLYSRATNVTQTFDRLVMQVLSPVIMPAVAAQSRAGGDLKAIYLKSIELISAVQWPFLLVVALLADPLIRVWLGPQWMETVPLVRLLCIASLSLFMAPLTYPILVAIGRVRDTLTTSLISLLPSLIIIFICSFHGVWAVAASSLITLPLQAAVAVICVGRHLAIRPAEVGRATAKSALISLYCISGVVVSLAISRISGAGSVTELLLAGPFAAAGWWTGLTLVKHPLAPHLGLAASSARRTLLPLSFRLR